MDDGDRLVDLSDERDRWNEVLLSESADDDTDTGWDALRRRNDDRLLAERPPHWD